MKMSCKIERNFTRKSKSLGSIPKQHIPKVDIEISSEFASNDFQTHRYSISANRTNSRNFPLRTSQRPKSVKKNVTSLSGTSTRVSSSSERQEGKSQHFHKSDLLRYGNATNLDSKNAKKGEIVRAHLREENVVKNYVKHYTNTRIFGSHAKQAENVLLERRRKLKENKTANAKIPLMFSSEVVKERSEGHLIPYTGPSKELFKFKPVKTQKPRKLKPLGIISRHQVCLPCSNYEKFKRPDTSYLHSATPNSDDEELFFNIPHTTALWEQYALSLVSKNTAQWIANRCSSGENRNRLIQFLDDMYDIDYEENGAISVRKLLDNDDDCITVQNIKRNEQMEQIR